MNAQCTAQEIEYMLLVHEAEIEIKNKEQSDNNEPDEPDSQILIDIHAIL